MMQWWKVTGVAMFFFAIGADFATVHVETWQRLIDSGVVAYKKGRYAEAEDILQAAVKAAEKTGKQDRRLVISLNNLAIVYDRQRKYTRAEPPYKRSLAIHEISAGSARREIGASLLDLANSISTMAEHDLAHGNDHANAQRLFQQALAIKEKVQGAKHPDVSVCLSRLAQVYQKQGKYAKAESLFRRALAIVEDAVGGGRLPENPSLVWRLNNLAQLYLSQGNYKKAEPLFRRALETVERGNGPEHPFVAGVLNDQAKLYRDQGHYAEAKFRYQRALAIYEKLLGSEDPHVADTLNELGVCYFRQGKYPDAEPLFKRALAIQEKILGPEDAAVATTLENYGALLRKTNRSAEAARMQARAKSIRDLPIGLD